MLRPILVGLAVLAIGGLGIPREAQAQVDDAQLLLIYTSLQMGWQTNAHCKTLNAENTAEFSTHLARITERVERRIEPGRLNQATETARTLAPILGCSPERAKIVEDNYASARALSQALGD